MKAQAILLLATLPAMLALCVSPALRISSARPMLMRPAMCASEATADDGAQIPTSAASEQLSGNDPAQPIKGWRGKVRDWAEKQTKLAASLGVDFTFAYGLVSNVNGACASSITGLIAIQCEPSVALAMAASVLPAIPSCGVSPSISQAVSRYMRLPLRLAQAHPCMPSGKQRLIQP